MNDLLVMTQIAGRRCALRAHDVQSVIEIGAISPVPRAPEFIAGITAMRSQALTVIDCRLALGFDPEQWPCDDRAIVVAVDGYSYALRIDSIEDITTGMDEVGDIPGGFGQEWSRVATGMIETRTGPALLIDLAALIRGPEAIGAAA
ncbi:chemotaxis protein CheW [Qipengyuania sp. ASV99]|uniref:chemotaxis protein CheW n=1 Tax=Qipengyuania sp. ASV99 TaxID=3399681 RepID=UPI003A4C8468